MSTTLTPDNYNSHVLESRSLWLIQVYDSTNQYCHYFSEFWEEIIANYGHVVQFGRIDIWHQSEMTSYVPYRFQVFPGIYTSHKGTENICHFNYEDPMGSLKRCI